MSGVYVSFPFCAQKCSFCNFASGVFPAALQTSYVSAVAEEIGAQEWSWTPDTVYIGGGTPSRLDPAALGTILERIPGRPWIEATIEAAPGSLTAENVAAWREAGINRVSLGVQSFVKEELLRTGRRHDADVAANDIALLRDNGINNINVDLIAGLPYQTNPTWIESIDWIERLQPPHVSVYMFEIDEDSRLGLEVLNGGSRFGAGQVPSEDLAADLYGVAMARLREMGILRYEISNFARPGMESRHNLKYWRLDPYIGFGADAHSFDGRERYANVESAADYVERWRAGLSLRNEPNSASRPDERLFLGLRLLEGVAPTPAEWQQFGEPIRRSVDAGLLEQDGSRVRLTDRGVLLSNEVFQEFISL
jgi:oxygen-independent coproporphyrinogen III oxidase